MGTESLTPLDESWAVAFDSSVEEEGSSKQTDDALAGTPSTSVTAEIPIVDTRPTEVIEATAIVSRRALLIAGEAVISEKGFARSTIEDVCNRAKVEPAVFYAYFQGMGGLLRALSEMFVEQMVVATDQSTKRGIWKGAPARDVIEVAVRTIIDVVVDRRGLVRAFLSHGATDEALMIDLRKIGSHMATRIVEVLAECTNVPTRPSRAVAFSLLVAAGLVHHWILVGDEWSGVSFTKDQLAEEASQAICAYLGLKPTIAIMPDSNAPDLARTSTIQHLKTDECVAIDDEEPPPTE